MKRTIRSNVYETNSSSTHAICISKERTKDLELPKEITFHNDDEFGWEFRTYYDTYSKANYLNEAINDCYLAEEAIDKKKQLFNMLKGQGIKVEFQKDEISYWALNYGYNNVWLNNDGYIDHGSNAKEFVDALLEDEELLMEYLFGDAFIVTGNDNSDSFSDYMYDESRNTYKAKFNDYQIFRKGN